MASRKKIPVAEAPTTNQPDGWRGIMLGYAAKYRAGHTDALEALRQIGDLIEEVIQEEGGTAATHMATFTELTGFSQATIYKALDLARFDTVWRGVATTEMAATALVRKHKAEQRAKATASEAPAKPKRQVNPTVAQDRWVKKYQAKLVAARDALQSLPPRYRAAALRTVFADPDIEINPIEPEGNDQ